MAEKASHIAKWGLGLAILGFVLSSVSTAFSVYQWWNSQRRALEAATVEFSSKYMTDESTREGTNSLSSPAVDEDDLKKGKIARNHLQRMEYIAFLINTGKLDDSFVAPAIKCDIWIAYILLQLKQVPKWARGMKHPEITKVAGTDGSMRGTIRHCS